MKQEEWRSAVGWEERYEVSSLGRVRSKPHWQYGANVYGPIAFMTKSKVLTPTKLSTRYLQVKLYDGFGGSRMKLVHRLVAEAFLPLPGDGQVEVNHKNLYRADNAAINLEWATPQENRDHAAAFGPKRMPRGEGHKNSKLTEDDVREIRQRASNETLAALGRDFGVGYQTIASVISGKTWKHVK